MKITSKLKSAVALVAFLISAGSAVGSREVLLEEVASLRSILHFVAPVADSREVLPEDAVLLRSVAQAFAALRHPNPDALKTRMLSERMMSANLVKMHEGSRGSLEQTVSGVAAGVAEAEKSAQLHAALAQVRAGQEGADIRLMVAEAHQRMEELRAIAGLYAVIRNPAPYPCSAGAERAMSFNLMVYRMGSERAMFSFLSGGLGNGRSLQEIVDLAKVVVRASKRETLERALAAFRTARGEGVAATAARREDRRPPPVSASAAINPATCTFFVTGSAGGKLDETWRGL